MACELFGFSNDDLIGLQLNDLITLKAKSPTTITESHLEDSGEIVEVCGKVVDAIDASGTREGREGRRRGKIGAWADR